MIIVKVELHSAITGKITQIARMHIANLGDSDEPNIGNYSCATFRGRDDESLSKFTVQRRGIVRRHARLREHVWNLVAKALRTMDYGNSVEPRYTARRAGADVD